MDLLVKTEIFLDQFQSGMNKDWETEILPVIEATLNKDDFVFVNGRDKKDHHGTGDHLLSYNDYVEQLNELYHKGLRLEYWNAHRIYGTPSIQYHCKVFWTGATGRLLAEDDHTCCMSYDIHGKAIRIQPSHPELYHPIFHTVEEKKEGRRY
jgi:hypothetical protein